MNICCRPKRASERAKNWIMYCCCCCHYLSLAFLHTLLTRKPFRLCCVQKIDKSWPDCASLAHRVSLLISFFLKIVKIFKYFELLIKFQHVNFKKNDAIYLKDLHKKVQRKQKFRDESVHFRNKCSGLNCRSVHTTSKKCHISKVQRTSLPCTMCVIRQKSLELL